MVWGTIAAAGLGIIGGVVKAIANGSKPTPPIALKRSGSKRSTSGIKRNGSLTTPSHCLTMNGVLLRLKPSVTRMQFASRTTRTNNNESLTQLC